MSSWVTIGRLGAPYGVRGWLHLQSFTQVPESLFEYQHWEVEYQKGLWKAYRRLTQKVHGKGLVVALEGIETRDAAATLTNCFIRVAKEALPVLPEDQFYWSDLEGLEVVSSTGQVLGTVAYVYEAGAADVLVVVQDQKEQHIPFIFKEVVQSVDYASRRIVVDWDVDTA